jgi:hypothetical protein
MVTPFAASLFAFTGTALLLALSALGGVRLWRADVPGQPGEVRPPEGAPQGTQTLDVAQAVPDVEHERARGRAEESERILLTIQAMREATEFDPAAEHVLNRVEAAVTRLSTSTSVGRPTLPARVAHAWVPGQPDLDGASSPPLVPGGAPVLPIEVPVSPSDDGTGLTVPAPTPVLRETVGAVLPVPLQIQVPVPGAHAGRRANGRFRRGRGRHAGRPFAFRG